ncbi:hypothetical protein [Clostridium botulinum]|uniref:hypothetical protein n=1 Tax=Clostridium botulinum TaxID=1491 RepID=UPI0007742D18|nr:hypothetical protein [Clostridium botulinum]MBY6931882.1 hypothetical protein [Clostridium botulinum]NFG20553.1 hypothetical protein [Clostridium botulinum]NFO81111.1 hypothetical protein [Clostridium botulinum]
MLDEFIQYQKQQLDKSIKETYLNIEIKNINSKLLKLLGSIEGSNKSLANEVDFVIGELQIVVSNAYYNQGFKDGIEISQEIKEVKRK